MLDFSHLHILDIPHQAVIPLLGTDNFWIVGGGVRDLLLGTKDKLNDIDLTIAGDPDQIWANLPPPDEHRARFRTEKFGTMTLIYKGAEESISYEITPFREESGYADNRHPDKIIRSNDLLADSARRDFTINALYRSSYEMPKSDEPVVKGKAKTTPTALKNDQHLLDILKQHGGCFLNKEKVLILQSPDLIKSFLKNPSNTALLHELPHLQTATKTQSKQASVILDPQYGLNDLIQRKLRAVGNPVSRFTEDALRILRGLRFVNILNQRLPDTNAQNSCFDFDKKTRQAMQKTAPLIQYLSAERLQMELTKVFEADNPFGYVSLLRELELLPYIFPALTKTIGNQQPVRYHPFDTYDHTLLTLWHLQQLLKDTPSPENASLKFAMLYHDVGKPEQYAFMDAALAANPENPDRTGYVGHTEIGVRLAKEDFTKLAFGSKQIDQICRYIKQHHRPGEILDSNPDTRQKKLRELLSEGGYEATMGLLTIAIADRLGQYNPLQAPAVAQLEQLKELTTLLYEAEGRFTMKQLATNGNELMKEFGIGPGPQLGELLEEIFTRVMEDAPTRNTKKQIFAYVKKKTKD